MGISEAVKAAKIKLGEGDDWYELEAELVGQANPDGTGGGWNIIFGHKNGRKKQVVVDFEKEHVRVDITPWHGAAVWSYTAAEVPVVTLGKLREEISTILASRKIKATSRFDTPGLNVTYRVRDFQVYAPLAHGEYSESLRSVQGPGADGFAIDSSMARFDDVCSPYWDTIIGSRLLGNGERLWLRLQVGERIDDELRRELVNILFGV